MTQLFDLQRTHNPHRFYLPVTRPLCGGTIERPFLFGGVGIAAALEAMETTCGRPVMWITAQYVSYARLSSVVDFDVRVSADGRHTSQARAIGHVGDQEVIVALAALGARPGGVEASWPTPPDVPPPEDCPPFPASDSADAQNVHSRFDLRLASSYGPVDGPGVDRNCHMRIWARPREGVAVDRRLLAVVGDFVSRGIRSAVNWGAGGNSLDNTIRFVTLAPTEWILCDIAIDSVWSGVVHGGMRMFSQDGVFMANTSTSLVRRAQRRSVLAGLEAHGFAHSGQAEED